MRTLRREHSKPTRWTHAKGARTGDAPSSVIVFLQVVPLHQEVIPRLIMVVELSLVQTSLVQDLDECWAVFLLSKNHGICEMRAKYREFLRMWSL